MRGKREGKRGRKRNKVPHFFVYFCLIFVQLGGIVFCVLDRVFQRRRKQIRYIALIFFYPFLICLVRYLVIQEKKNLCTSCFSYILLFVRVFCCLLQQARCKKQEQRNIEKNPGRVRFNYCNIPFAFVLFVFSADWPLLSYSDFVE